MRHLLLLLGILFSLHADARDKTICLNMIVKNEAHVIARCLNSVKDSVDYWVIVDTGSDDGTQQIIRDLMKDVPGELHERPWVHFAHNRNEALDFARNKADYTLFIDADEELVFSQGAAFPPLDKDGYIATVHQVGQGVDYGRLLLIDNRLDWVWKGVVHEDLESTRAKRFEVLKGITNFSHTNGSRSQDPQKYLKDAKLLEDALKEDPSNSRYVYYLAQSYLNVPDYALALKYYDQRAKMGGWDQEVFYSLYCVGLMQRALGQDLQVAIDSFNQAFQYRSSRIEPLYRLVECYLHLKNYTQAYLIAQFAKSLPDSKDAVFVEHWMHDWGALLQFAECSYYLGKYSETRSAIRELLANPRLPEDKRESLTKNLILVEGL